MIKKLEEREIILKKDNEINEYNIKYIIYEYYKNYYKIL
jgi:hypothetical protein